MNNKIVIIILVLVAAGTAVIGLIPQSPRNSQPAGSNSSIESPTFSQNYNLPSLLGMAVWPTASPTPILPTSTPTPTPTSTPIPTSTPAPTAIIPTAAPQPTALPAPTNPPAPPALTLATVRPGTNLTEMAQIAERYTCTPAALLLAIKKQETGDGARFLSITTNPTYVRYYNTYGWWSYASAGESYFGLNYNTITGYAPADAAPGVANTRIAQPIGNTSAGSQWIMGIMQLNQSEQDRVRARFQQAFRGQNTPDRRVAFDAMVLAGFLYKSLSTQTSGCNLDWSIRDIAIVGCKFHGACIANYVNPPVDYCRNVCEYYGQYGGRQFNCANISNLVAGSSSGCVLR